MAPLPDGHAYDNIHLYVRLLGHFGTSSVQSDNWSAGVRVGFNDSSDIPFNTGPLQTFADAVKTAAQTLHGHASTLAGTSCFLDRVTVARIGKDGFYAPLSQLTTVSDAGAYTGSGSPNFPWNTAGVVSLRTSLPRGYASNGRFYYPMLSASLTATTGRLGNTAVTNRLAQFKTFFNAVNTAANTYAAGAGIRVYSTKAHISATVTSIRADDRMDSQERRENATPSTWQTATIP